MIFQLVSDSDELLSPKDRLELMHAMIEESRQWTPEVIAEECKKKADQNSGDNMLNAMILRDAHYNL